jgi:hypothetical protein
LFFYPSPDPSHRGRGIFKGFDPLPKNPTAEEFIHKARENLKAAELLFENGLYNASANRAYYAALHFAISILAKMGIEADQS